MRGVAALVVTAQVAGCGRLGFDPLGVAGDASVPSWPNKPATCAFMIDTTFGTVPPSGWSVENTVDSSIDTSAPYDPSVARWTFPIGFQAGVPGRLVLAPPELTNPNVRELYLGLVWKFSDPWQSASSGVNHLLYVDQDNGGGGIHNTLQLHGTGPYSLDASYDGNDLAANVSDVMITTGAWHTVELHRRSSTTATSQDGLVEWWLDGTLIGRHPDVSFMQFAFSSVKLEPDWASVAQPKTELDYVWMDRAALCLP